MIIAYGTRPTKSVGRRFARMMETWDPLWEYCETRYGDITDEIEVDVEDGGTLVLEKENAVILAAWLRADIEDGIVAEYVEARKLVLSAVPSRRCPSCDGTGIRTDEVGQDLGMETIELGLQAVLRLGRTHGWCDTCYGEGATQKWERDCRLEVKDVDRFADFLISSGGCRIY